MNLLNYNIAERHLPKQHHRLMFLSIVVTLSWISSFNTVKTIYSLTSVDTTTTVTVSNSGPVFSVDPGEDSASTGSAPTNVDSNVTFKANATDVNGDQFYLAICRTNSITANNNAAPTCATNQTLCVSSAVNSAAQASCNYRALTGDTETVAWYGFACDHSSGSACTSASQGSSDSGSPFNVNHNPTFTSIAPGSAVDPGQDMDFDAVAQDDDVDTVQDTVHLIVCSSAGASTSGCTNPANQLCASSNVTSDPSCSYSTPGVFAAGNHNYYPYIFDQHGLGATTNPRNGTYSINNKTPSLSNLTLNSGNPINLTVSTTTSVVFTFTASDVNGYGTISSYFGKLYRTAVGVGAADNANEHYTLASCNISNQSGATADYSCSFNVQYHADPTDVANTQYYSDTWTATASVTDSGSLNASSSATPVELNSLLGIGIDSDIDFGNLAQGTDTGAVNELTQVSAQGNTGLNSYVQGIDMSDGLGHTIAKAYQKYSDAAFTYSSGGTVLTGSDVFLDLRVVKTTTTATPAYKSVYWGIAIPTGIPAGNYTGLNTLTGEVSSESYW